VVIRTLDGRGDGPTCLSGGDIGTGGAVIFASDPEEEHAEILLKAERLLSCLEEVCEEHELI
jgi:anthranilate/para-aminobenzoate synthase component I